MNWFNILIYSAGTGISHSGTRKALQKAGQSGEQEVSWVWRLLGFIGVVVVGIVAFAGWRDGIHRRVAEEMQKKQVGEIRRIENQPPPFLSPPQLPSIRVPEEMKKKQMDEIRWRMEHEPPPFLPPPQLPK